MKDKTYLTSTVRSTVENCYLGESTVGRSTRKRGCPSQSLSIIQSSVIFVPSSQRAKIRRHRGKISSRVMPHSSSHLQQTKKSWGTFSTQPRIRLRTGS